MIFKPCCLCQPVMCLICMKFYYTLHSLLFLGVNPSHVACRYFRIANFVSNSNIPHFINYHLDKCVVHGTSARVQGHVPWEAIGMFSARSDGEGTAPGKFNAYSAADRNMFNLVSWLWNAV